MTVRAVPAPLVFPAYIASFKAGWRQAMRDKADALSALLVYGTLLLIFAAIYNIMPVDELHVPGLSAHNLLWYFAIAEAVTVANPGLAMFGKAVADGDIADMMRRPVNLTLMFIARLVGMHLFTALLLFAFAMVALPTLAGAAFPLPLIQVPLLFVSMALSTVLFAIIGCMLGAIEVLGPYSRPLSWIVGKFIFAFGGLFFPVAYFPPLVQKIVMLTPFPAIIGLPGSFMLPEGAAHAYAGLGIQVLWVAVLAVGVMMSERRMLRYVLDRGA